MRITALSGGIGGARFLRGLLRVLDADDEVTVIGNTADDIWLFGLKVCPDLDTVMYTLGSGIDDERGWGRVDETWNAKEELAAYGVEPTWFGLGDRDLATHVVRTQMLQAGYSLTDVTARPVQPLAGCRSSPRVRLLPMSDDRVETHIVVRRRRTSRRRHARSTSRSTGCGCTPQPPVRDVVVVGLDDSTPAPGVIEAIADCDVLLLPPSNPVVSVGTVLGVPGVRAAVRARPRHRWWGCRRSWAVRRYAAWPRRCWRDLGVEVSAAGVGAHYGARSAGGVARRLAGRRLRRRRGRRPAPQPGWPSGRCRC